MNEALNAIYHAIYKLMKKFINTLKLISQFYKMFKETCLFCVACQKGKSKKKT